MWFSPENAIACAAILSTGKTTRRNTAEYIVTLNSGHCYRLSTGTSMAEKAISEFETLAGVENVSVGQNGSRLVIDVEMSIFDRASRRNAYAKEWQLYKEHPGYTFDVRLIDRSPRQGTDAVQG
jgi:hypothetical protein